MVADNDKTGEQTAKDIGWPYWISDVEGEDANDYFKRVGMFRFSQSLLKSLNLFIPTYGATRF